jgi:hypothetical protein
MTTGENPSEEEWIIPRYSEDELAMIAKMARIAEERAFEHPAWTDEDWINVD